MTKKGFIIFFIVFVIVYSLIQLLLFEKTLTVMLLIESLVAGLVTIGLIYLIKKIE